MSVTAPKARGARIGVLAISLDAQIAAGSVEQKTLGDPVERQRRYAAQLRSLHVIVKTPRRRGGPERVELAENAWAYATRSASRYSFALDAYLIGARLLAAEPIDVVSAQDPFATGLVAYLLAARFGKPLNVQVHFDVLDNPYWIGEKPEHRALNVLGKWLIRRATTVRVGSTREAAKMARWGVLRERICVAPVPVDLSRFAAGELSVKPSATLGPVIDHAPLVLAACRLVPQKDIPTLLRAAARVREQRPDVRFVIAGDGPLLERLRTMASDANLSGTVRFLGSIVDRRTMPGVMAAANVFAVSSAYEGTSLVTVEAAAAGVPVVTTDVAGAADTVIDGVTGRVVPVGDSRAMAGALLEVLADPRKAARMGEAARAHVQERFGLERSVGQVVEMWQATAECGAGR